MKILALERDLKPIPAEGRAGLLKREAAAAWTLQQEGSIREIYMTAARTRAVIILEAADEGEASAALARLPLVAEGFCAFDLLSLEAYPGYARLFGG